MSIVSKNKALTLASTAVVLFCGNIVSAGSEPLFNIDVSDKAAISFSNGVNESYAYTSDYKIRALTTGSTKRAWGILVSKSLTAPTIFGFDGSQGGSLSIFTEGDKAHGAQVGATAKLAYRLAERMDLARLPSPIRLSTRQVARSKPQARMGMRFSRTMISILSAAKLLRQILISKRQVTGPMVLSLIMVVISR